MPTILMSSIEIVTLVVTIICLVSFSLVFTILFHNHYRSETNLIKEGKMDVELIDNALIEEQKSKSTSSKVGKVFGKIASWGLLAVVGVAFAYSLIARISNNLVLVNNQALIVISTGSMSTKNEVNGYLNFYNLNNQIQTYDIVQVQKYKSQSDVKQYDVVAFHDNANRVIVHRIIEIKTDGTYITKGDSNKLDDVGSLYNGALHYEDILGFYTGVRVPMAGIFVIFLQSNAGICTVIAVAYCFFMFDHMRNKYLRAIDDRMYMLVDLLNYDMTREIADDVTTSFDETLIYKGYAYHFKEGIFVFKEKIEEKEEIIDQSL